MAENINWKPAAAKNILLQGFSGNRLIYEISLKNEKGFYLRRFDVTANGTGGITIGYYATLKSAKDKALTFRKPRVDSFNQIVKKGSRKFRTPTKAMQTKKRIDALFFAKEMQKLLRG